MGPKTIPTKRKSAKKLTQLIGLNRKFPNKTDRCIFLRVLRASVVRLFKYSVFRTHETLVLRASYPLYVLTWGSAVKPV